MKLPEKLMLNKVPKPSEELLSHWKSEVENWLSDAINSIGKLSNKLVLDAKLSASTISTLHENLASFWEIPEDCWRRSNTYADFNGFLMSHVVNGAWGYDTVFVRFSECQQVFVDEFRFLLSRFKDYTRLLKEADEITQSEGVHGGVAGQESSLAPFWYHCSCGSKAKLFVEMRDGFLSASGSCVRCGRPYRFDFGHGIEVELEKMASRISARAIPMGLVLFNGLQPSCYVGGVAGQAYLAEAQHVAEGLGIVFPPIVVWRPCDKYVGVGQAEASLELQQASIATGARDFAGTRDLVMSQISKIRGRLDEIEASKKSLIQELKKNPDDEELKEKLRSVSMAYTRACRSSDLSVLYYRMKIIENAMVVSGLMPSIIDYAVNVGLRETRDQWERYLNGEGGLKSDVCLESVLSRDGDLNSALLRV